MSERVASEGGPQSMALHGARALEGRVVLVVGAHGARRGARRDDLGQEVGADAEVLQGR